VSDAALPSGEQFEIRYGDQVAVVTEVGATIRDYRVAGEPVLDGFAAEEVCTGGRGQQLIPWPNRIRDGRYPFAGRTQQLALTEPSAGNAIHGLARWAGWRPTAVDAARVELSVTVHPQPGWPGTIDATVAVELSGQGLAVTTTVHNSGRSAVPFGAGTHPYLTVGTERIDSARLLVPGGRCALPDDRGIPVGGQSVADTPYDFRSPRVIGDLVLDTAYADLARDGDGRWRVTLAGPDRSVTVWADESYPWLQVFSGDTLPPARARAGLAVEPMTCGPDAFNTGDDLLVLQPGDRHSGTWGITVEPASS
jgi:aldose 1-epimerase